ANCQRPNPASPIFNPNKVNKEKEKPKPKTTTHAFTNIPAVKPSFASVVHGPNSKGELPTSTNIQSISQGPRSTLQSNDSMKSLSLAFKTVTSYFRVDERMIWIEISGLPLCAWGSTAFKKVAYLFGNFTFFEVDRSAAINIEIGTWSINILDDSLDSQSTEDKKNVEKAESFKDVNSVNGLEDLINDLNKDKGHNDVNLDDVTSLNYLSCPPGFEHYKKETSNTRKCSTSFARYKKKDIKGISLINQMIRIIEVGDSLGFDVRGYRISLKRMIDGIGAYIVDK
ncbi:hypothetical protein Tco_0484080, partial [Tanacetum coccineum]